MLESPASVVIRGVDSGISSRDISFLRFFERNLMTTTMMIIAITAIAPIVHSIVCSMIAGAAVVALVAVLMSVGVEIALLVSRSSKSLEQCGS